MSNENAKDLQDANEKVLQDMIKYAEKLTREEIPNEAVIEIIKILKDSGPLKNFYKYVNGPSNQVVQVEYGFEGETREKKKWDAQSIISADMSNPARKQAAHFGCDIYVNKKRIISTHKWLPDGTLHHGRPLSRDAQPLEEFQTGYKRIDFGGQSYAIWISTSSKYP